MTVLLGFPPGDREVQDVVQYRHPEFVYPQGPQLVRDVQHDPAEHGFTRVDTFIAEAGSSLVTRESAYQLAAYGFA
jgi:hypothetical protein